MCEVFSPFFVKMLRALVVIFGLYFATQVWAYEQKMIMIENGDTFFLIQFILIFHFFSILFHSIFPVFCFLLYHFFLENVLCGPLICPLNLTTMSFFSSRVTKDARNGSYVTTCGTCLAANGIKKTNFIVAMLFSSF